MSWERRWERSWERSLLINAEVYIERVIKERIKKWGVMDTGRGICCGE